VTDLSDYTLLKTSDDVTEPQQRRALVVPIAIALLVAAAAVAAYIVFRKPALRPGAVATAQPPASASSSVSAPEAAPVVPPLDQTDPVVRKLVDRKSVV